MSAVEVQLRKLRRLRWGLVRQRQRLRKSLGLEMNGRVWSVECRGRRPGFGRQLINFWGVPKLPDEYLTSWEKFQELIHREEKVINGRVQAVVTFHLFPSLQAAQSGQMNGCPCKIKVPEVISMRLGRLRSAAC